LFHADRQTDRHDEANSRFINAPKRKNDPLIKVNNEFERV